MQGILTKAIGGFFFVASEEQKIYQTRIRGKIKEKIYPGDRVGFDPDELVLEEVYPRDNLLFRPNVANVEQVVIMHSFENPQFSAGLLDRFLLMVEAAELKPIIVLNKMDRVKDNSDELLAEYSAAGYDIFFISVKKEEGLAELFETLHGKINVLTGPSGVGKSSFINKVVEEADLPTAGVSKRLGRGVHTTRMVELISVGGNGWLADTPGFSSLQLADIEANELVWLFPELAEYNNSCRFNGCSHTHEPGCAVKQAVEEQSISASRYESYCKIYKELKNKKRVY